MRVILAAAALLLAGRAVAAESLAVLAVDDPPTGPDGDLAELAHQLRAACRDRVGGVEDVPTMRARLLGETSNATLSELDRAYGGALAVYQNGEFESSVRTLRAIIDDLESLPETDDGYLQWVRAQLRYAHAALTVGLERDADAAFLTLARTDPSVQADPEQYSPPFRRRLDHARAKAKALVARRLTVTAAGNPGAVFVNGRRMGTTPLSLSLPTGRYRIGGSAGSLRVPSFWLDLEPEDRSIVLDFALAQALRPNAGPGLALEAERRGDGIVRAGAWLGADRVVAVSRVHEGEAQFLLGSIYDVRRGALLREGSVRMVAGSVPSVNLAALASFLLTGQSSRDVTDRTGRARSVPAVASSPREAAVAGARPAGVAPAPLDGGVRNGSDATPPAVAPPSRLSVATAPGPAVLPAPAPRGGDGSSTAPPTGPRPRWMRRGAFGAGILAGGFTGLAIQQALTARSAYADANAMVAYGDVLLPGSDGARYRDLVARGDAATRNAYVSAGAAVVFATAAGVLGWRSREPPAVRF